MGVAELTSRDAVLKAVEKFDRLGQDRFLKKYGFGRSRWYVLEFKGRTYDSKAIIGVALGYQFSTRGPLRASDFSGGYSTVKRKLEELKFIVRRF